MAWVIPPVSNCPQRDFRKVRSISCGTVTARESDSTSGLLGVVGL